MDTDKARFNSDRQPFILLVRKKPSCFSVVLNGEVVGIKIGRELVCSADLCYNGVNARPPSEREGDRDSGGRSLRDFELG